MHYPFINFDELSIEQLFEKVSDIQQRLVYARMNMLDDTLVAQLEGILDSLMMEQIDRYRRMEFDMINSQFPEVIESDPEFKDGKSTVSEKSNTNPFRKNQVRGKASKS